MTRALIKRSIQLAKIPVDELLEASCGTEALATVRREHVDLVLADLNMPEMDGAALTRAILGDPATKNIPVVVVSADPNAARAKELGALGVRGYVRKPFTPEVIRDTLTGILGGANV